MKIKLIHANARLPFKERVTDTGWDLTASERKVIRTLGLPLRIEYNLGIKMQPDDHMIGMLGAQLRPRSSIHKTGLILSNSVGTADTEYTGELKAVFYSTLLTWIPWLRKEDGEWKFDWNRSYKVGDRICQWIPEGIDVMVTWDTNTPFKETGRGAKGYGSSGN